MGMSKKFYLKHKSHNAPPGKQRKTHCYFTQYIYPIHNTSTCHSY